MRNGEVETAKCHRLEVKNTRMYGSEETKGETGDGSIFPRRRTTDCNNVG